MSARKVLTRFLDVNDDNRCTTVDIFTWGLLLFFVSLVGILILSTPLHSGPAAIEHLISLHNAFSTLVAGVLVATLVRAEKPAKPILSKKPQQKFVRSFLRLLDFDHDYELSTFDVAISFVTGTYTILLLTSCGLLFFLSSNLEIGRAVQQECRDRSRMPSSA
eukprot:TRINITY_DN41030_c0_g1_i5.p1 TRINITY_DN41030_c0_g1~~TRINITY_DN41030_c0_g1_i5.p1  ORF type:complete len:163 (-),score=11.30 TRINITY_DN41030_c0_g1_i5:10-498(-)